MKTSNRSAGNRLSPILTITCALWLSGCGGTAEQHLATTVAFSYKYCTTTSQVHGGYTAFAKRTFQALVIGIPAQRGPDDTVVPVTATAEIDYDEFDGSKRYVGRNVVTVTGEFNFRTHVLNGTFTFSEIGYWTRPDVDADYKCQYNSTFRGGCVTSDLNGSETITRLTSQGTTTLDTYSSWDSGERSATDHSSQSYAYALDLVEE